VGALKNPHKYGQSNYQVAFEQIHWWLKRQWAHLTVITAVESFYAALGYTEGNAQQQAAAVRAQAQAKDDWRDDDAYRQLEAEIAAPFFGDFLGGLPSTPFFESSELLWLSFPVELIPQKWQF
jgi:hypothetical protein